MRLVFVVLALLAGAAAQAQTSAAPARQVELLAPQLVTFTGSTANFESLVNGLTTGAPVTLTTFAADGTVQIVTFLPGRTMPAADAARVLESARQNLIARGIAVPTAQQLAAALIGSGNANTVQVRSEAFPAAPSAAGATSAFPPAGIEALRASLPPVVTASLSGTDFNQALQLAVVLLAQQGIVDPTAEQLRTALLGGTLKTATGASITLQGLLQPRVRSASESSLFGTSNSAIIGTSNTPASANPVTTAPTTATGAGLVRPPAARPALIRLGAKAGG